MVTTDHHDDSDRSGDPLPDRDDWTRYLEERGLFDVSLSNIARHAIPGYHVVSKAAVHRALVRKIREGWQPGTWPVRDERDEPTHPAPVLASPAQIDTFYAWVYRRGLERLQKRNAWPALLDEMRSNDDE